MDMLQATRKTVWKQFGKEERWEMEPPVRDGNVAFPRRDTGSDLRVKKVRFCEVEPMQIAQKRIYGNGKKKVPCNKSPAAAHMFCDEHQQITIEANKKASKQVRLCDSEPRQTTSSSPQLMKLFGKAGIPDMPTPEEHADMPKETRRDIYGQSEQTSTKNEHRNSLAPISTHWRKWMSMSRVVMRGSKISDLDPNLTKKQ